MNFQQLGYVLAVCRERNFLEAAEKCNVTQSTLSAMILRFEEEIGISIFDRKTKPVTITKEGSTVIEKIKLILKETDDLKELVKELKGELSGELQIGVIPTIAPFVLPLFLGDFSKSYPGITLNIRESITESITTGLLNRTLDIGLLSLPVDHPDLIPIPLYDEQYRLYSHVNDNHISEKKANLRDINKEKLWLLAEGHCMRTQIQELCTLNKELKEWGNLNYEAGSIDTLIRLVKQTGGLTLLPHLATVSFSEQEKEHLFSFHKPVPVRKVGLLVHKHFVKKKLLELMRSQIMEAVGKYLTVAD